MMASRRRVGVMGGTFDPPHLAHLAAGAATCSALGLDVVLFVPAGEPWRWRRSGCNSCGPLLSRSVRGQR